MTPRRNNLEKNHVTLSVLLLALAGCTAPEKVAECPTPSEEPVSVCRAREHCRAQTSSVGLGLGLGMGMGTGFGAGGFGVGVSQSQATDRYERCLDRNLMEQEKKSKNEMSPELQQQYSQQKPATKSPQP